MTQPLPSMRLQFKNQQHNNQSFNFERKPGPEAVLGPRNLTRATEGEGPHQPWWGLNVCSTNLVGCSLGSELPLWASQSPWIQRLFPALVCCLLFCKQHNRVSPPPPPPRPSDGGYLFLVTSLRIPGGVASRPWMGLCPWQALALPSRHRVEVGGSETAEVPSLLLHHPCLATTQLSQVFTPLPRNPKLMGPED